MHNITQPILPGLQPPGTGPFVLTSDGIAVASLSPQECSLYPSLFKMALGAKAIQTSSVIPAAVAANFLKRSGLSKKQLHDIWTLADPDDAGFLTPDGFYKACRLVAHAQCGSFSITPDLLSAEPQSLPYFENADGGPDAEWKVSESEIRRYADLYRREGGTHKLDGSDARALLLKSGLSTSELCDVWDLADADKDGKLTFGEFIVVMQLVSKIRDGKAFLPPDLPKALAEYLKTPLPESPSAVPTSDTPQVPSSLPVSEPTPRVASEPLITSRPVANIGFGSTERSSPLEARTPAFPASPSMAMADRELAAEQRSVADAFGRHQQFRKQALDGRSRLESLRQEAKTTEIELVSADHQVQRTQDQILSLQQQIAEAEDELDTFRREAGQTALGGDVLAAVSAIRESIGEDEREVLELRAKIERIQREKIDLQSTFSVLKEKKRQADQDRNLLIVALESDRAKLVSVRAERLQLWEQRHQLTRELTTKTFDQLNTQHGLRTGVLPSSAALVTSPVRVQAGRDRKGVRAETTSQPAPLHSANGAVWSRFGAGEAGFSDPVAGAFGGNDGADSPQFGTGPFQR